MKQIISFIIGLILSGCLPGNWSAKNIRIPLLTDIIIASERVPTRPGASDAQESAVQITQATVPFSTIDQYASTAPTESSPTATAEPAFSAEPELSQFAVPAEEDQISMSDQTASVPTMSEAVIPTGCSHIWQLIEHPETGHTVCINVCGCGYQFSDISAYDAHVSQYAGTAEMFTVHGHWGTVSQWVVDSAGWTEWRCSLCGEFRAD